MEIIRAYDETDYEQMKQEQEEKRSIEKVNNLTIKLNKALENKDYKTAMRYNKAIHAILENYA